MLMQEQQQQCESKCMAMFLDTICQKYRLDIAVCGLLSHDKRVTSQSKVYLTISCPRELFLDSSSYCEVTFRVIHYVAG